MKRFDELRQLHAKCQHLWVIDIFEEALQLSERQHERDVRVIDDGWIAVLQQVDRVTGDNTWRFGFGDDGFVENGSLAVFASVADE